MDSNKSLRKITKSQFLKIIKEEVIKAKYPNLNPDFDNKLKSIIERITEEMQSEIASLTYQLEEQFYELLDKELSACIRESVSR